MGTISTDFSIVFFCAAVNDASARDDMAKILRVPVNSSIAFPANSSI
jgi:hypothetical protein